MIIIECSQFWHLSFIGCVRVAFTDCLSAAFLRIPRGFSALLAGPVAADVQCVGAGTCVTEVSLNFKTAKESQLPGLHLTSVFASPQPVSFCSQTDTYSAVGPSL